MNKKTSVLISRQVPEFVREEYPLFIHFLEAYYEFLEEKQGIQLNDLLFRREKLLNIFDVDSSIDEFTIQFFNAFANFFPLDVSVKKEFLIKNVLPLYKARGSEKSFILLFKMIYGEDVEIEYPKNNILIASDGKWKIDHSIKISTEISSNYTCDGSENTYTLLLINSENYNNIVVYLDGILQEQNVDYYILKEYYKIVFNSIPPENSVIEIFYTNVNISFFNNRKIVGTLSGASVVVENAIIIILNNRQIYELYVDPKTLVGEFISGEILTSSVFVNGELVNVSFNSVSEIDSINIINGGSGYSLNDTINIETFGVGEKPKAFISKISLGSLSYILPTNGGCGYNVGGKIYIDGFSVPVVDVYINSVILDSIYPIYSPNTFIISSDIISDIDPSNTTIDSVDYGFLGYTGNSNVNTVISQTFSNTAFNDIGQISGLVINYVNLDFDSIPTFYAEPAKISVLDNEISISDFGSLGKLKIENSGINYVVGDEIEFINADKSWGLGAFAEITQVSSNGEIEMVEFVPAKISGTANVYLDTLVTVVGNDTIFNEELFVGSEIYINRERKTVVEISSNTSLNVNSSFSTDFTEKPIRLFNKYLLGGQGYTQDLLPTANIISSTGESGVILVDAVLGCGSEFDYEYSDSVYGQIQEVVIVDHGKNIPFVPNIEVLGGNGDAILEAKMHKSYTIFPGKWNNSDGFLSSTKNRLQDNNYYNKNSYIISSVIEFSKYKDIVKNLLHPVGMRVYGKYKKIDDIDIENSLDIETFVELN